MFTEVINHDGWVQLIDDFIPNPEADRDMQRLMNEIQWRRETLTLFGKKTEVPRLVGWHGDPGAIYRYSGVTHRPLPWTNTLLALKQQAENACQHAFNSVLVNLYRNGRDAMGWHSDNEKELGTNPRIASLSLGATRLFKLRHTKTGETVTIPLNSGSLLIMGGELQHHWRHSLPRTTKIDSPRINLTFRHILPHHRK